MGFIPAVLYAVVVLSPLIALAAVRLQGDMSLMHETGTGAAFAAYGIIALQPVLVARWKWIERPFGMDVLSRFHKYMGIFALCLLLTHPPLMAYGGAGTSLLYSLDLPWSVLLGKALLAVLAIHVVLSVCRTSLGLTFEKWRQVHFALAVIIGPVAFVHSHYAGYDLWPLVMQILWPALFVLYAAAIVHHKLVVPMQLRKHPYTVAAVDRESRNVWTVKLTPPVGVSVYEYQPGQFHFVTFQRSAGLPVEEHHWTVSSSPANKDFISSTIKESGDFTATIGKTRVGDTALVEGPFGCFSYTFYPEDRDFVFIAGGIGITPFISMIRHMRDTGKEADVLLLCANRTEEDIVFGTELAEIEAGSSPRLKVLHILSKPTGHWTGETGRLDRDKLTRLVGSKSEHAAYYICAPPLMAKAVIAGLRSMGVPYSRMRTEQFSL
jgi:predicted ferric reductase